VILLDFLPQLLKTFELWGETAFAGGVDDKDDLALSLGPKVKRLALLYKEKKSRGLVAVNFIACRSVCYSLLSGLKS